MTIEQTVLRCGLRQISQEKARGGRSIIDMPYLLTRLEDDKEV